MIFILAIITLFLAWQLLKMAPDAIGSLYSNRVILFRSAVMLVVGFVIMLIGVFIAAEITLFVEGW